MNTKPIGLASLLATTTLLAAIAAAPAAAASEGCSDDESGFGGEDLHCDFSCDPNQYVGVQVTVDDGGTVDGSASCGGALAECSGDSSCSGSSYPGRTGAATFGPCDGHGAGGFWTHATISCSTSDAGEDVHLSRPRPNDYVDLDRFHVITPCGGDCGTDPLGVLRDVHVDWPHAQMPPGLLFPQDPYVTSLAQITVGHGTVQGLSCTLDGCVEVVPRCIVTGDEWHCWL
jgi:hypothetical protein